MKSISPRSLSLSALIWAGSISLAAAAGVVTTCDEASLRTALVGGGAVTFACDGILTLANTVAITNDTSIDASGHAITISGGSTVRLFTVGSNMTFTVHALTLVNGFALGTNGAPASTGLPGGPGYGGAIYGNGGTIIATACIFQNNTARGGQGGTGGVSSHGPGGVGSGGAVFVDTGFLSATNCTFTMNYSLGGTGAVTSGFSVVSTGGVGQGGAIGTSAGSIQLVDCLLSNNQSIGGPGRRFNAVGIGPGGVAYGGALFTSTGQVWIAHCKLTSNHDQSTFNAPSFGGAIYQSGGSLQLDESVLTLNTVFGGEELNDGAGNPVPGPSAFGGALCVNAGSASISNSTLSANLAAGADGGLRFPTTFSAPGTGFGGAVFSAGALQIANSTLEGNEALAGGIPSSPVGPGGAPRGAGLGGALYNNGGSIVLDYVTIADNNARTTPVGNPATGGVLGGGIFSTNGTATIHCTIFDNNLSGSNGFATIVDNGHNLSSDSSLNFTGPGSLNNTDPKLGPLDNYGGPTPTMALLTGSPAIDGGDNSSCLPTDQRGRARPYGATCDIGAFESSAPFVIRGRFSGSTLQDEIAMAFDDGSSNSVADSYSLEGLPAASHLLVPDASKYLVIPTNLSVTVGPDQLNVDFKAYRWHALSLEGSSGGILHQIFAGTNGQSYRVQISSNLVNWTDVATNVMGPSNYFELFDPIGPDPERLYRVISP